MPLPMRLPGSKKKEDTAYSAVEVDPNRSDTDVSGRSNPNVPGWPSGPQHPGSSTIWIVADGLLLLMPVAFIALAALAYRLDGKDLSDYGENVREAILLGPTLFPLAFAALGGRSLKKIALWRAERGTTLGFLEHMIGSQSLVAAVGHAITLHSLNFLTLGLLLLWALSPLGGQSALRLVSQTNTTIVGSHPVFYANVDALSIFGTPSGGGTYSQQAVNQVDGVVKTSLMTIDTTEVAPMDIWQHPKIPRLSELEAAEEKNEGDRPWYSVDHSVNHTYAALTGLDVLNLPRTGKTNFTVPYEYMYFSCGLSPANNISTNASDPRYGMPWQRAQMDYLTGLQNASKLESGSYYNATGVTLRPQPGPLIGTDLQRSFFIYTKRANATKPESIIYGSRGIVDTTYYLFECSMKSVMVEADISCEASNCVVDRLRRLNKARKDRVAALGLPYDVVNEGYTNKQFNTHFIEMGGQTRNNVPNPIDQYVYGVKPWGKSETGLVPQMNWTQYVLEPEKTVGMSDRLTMFLNTYWDASRWPQAIARNDPYGLVSVNQTTGIPSTTLTMNQTMATTMQQKSIYKANAAWVAMLVICSCVLLLLGISSLVISLMTTVPDIFDYVSSFTRDNPFVNAPKGGSSIDGAERARLLRKLPIQLGDTNPAGEVGYISIRSTNGDEDRVAGRVRKARMYI